MKHLTKVPALKFVMLFLFGLWEWHYGDMQNLILGIQNVSMEILK